MYVTVKNTKILAWTGLKFVYHITSFQQIKICKCSESVMDVLFSKEGELTQKMRLWLKSKMR